MKISGKTQMCIIIGDPVTHSLSPAMHNAAYEALHIDDQFVFTAAQVKVEHVKDVVQAIRVMNIRGLTCTIPHKVEVMKYLDSIDPVAQKIGAVNTVVNDHGILKGYNTDWLGTVIPLEKITKLSGKKVLLLGAGGAARAMAFGVAEKGAHLTIYNRSLNKADALVNDLHTHGYTAHTINQISSLDAYEIILNSTPLGMHPHEDESPILTHLIQKHHIVFDAVYVPYETKLLKDAKARGARVIQGIQMLLHQGTAQFELYTGHKAPIDTMTQVLYDHFQIKPL